MKYCEEYTKEIEDYYKIIDREFLRNQVLLLSGGAGLIGSYLVDFLLCETTFHVKIYVLVRNIERAKSRFEKYAKDDRLTLVKCDVAKGISLDTKVDYVFHLASFTDPKNYAKFPVETMLTNFDGCKNLLDYAKTHGCKRFFLASSCEVYGTSVLPMTEDNVGEVNCLDVRSCYNESKRAAETLCISYKHEYCLDVVIGRFCRIYGPTALPEDSKALSQFLHNSISGNDVILKSQGNQRYSYLYVGDAVAGMLLLLNKGASGECYNIADDQDIMSLKEIAEHVAKFGKVKVVFETASDNEKNSYSRAIHAVLLSDKIKQLGFKPKYNLKQGVERTFKYLKQK